MTTPITRDFTEIGIRLLDEAYLAWCAAQVCCRDALRAWCEANPRDWATANAAYRAALDREEAAARDLERLSQIVRNDAQLAFH